MIGRTKVKVTTDCSDVVSWRHSSVCLTHIERGVVLITQCTNTTRTRSNSWSHNRALTSRERWHTFKTSTHACVVTAPRCARSPSWGRFASLRMLHCCTTCWRHTRSKSRRQSGVTLLSWTLWIVYRRWCQRFITKKQYVSCRCRIGVAWCVEVKRGVVGRVTTCRTRSFIHLHEQHWIELYWRTLKSVWNIYLDSALTSSLFRLYQVYIASGVLWDKKP